MTGRRIGVDAAASARLHPDGLEVTGDLFGSSHQFDHNGRRVTFEIPNVVLGPDLYPLESQQVLASFRRSWIHDPRPEVTSYAIHRIDVSMDVRERLSLPRKMLEMPPKRPEIAGKKLTSRLDALVIEYEQRIASAVDYWESVVRWISGSSGLGTPSAISGRESARRLQFMSLIQKHDHHRFWTPTHMISALRGTELNARVWSAIGSALSNGEGAPIWFRYLDEAHHRFLFWDARGSLISIAIACETVARECLWVSAGTTSSSAARNLLDRVSIRGILGNWNQLTGISKVSSRVREVGRIFDLRNRIMHSGGKGAVLDREDIRNLLAAAREFIQNSDKWYYEARALKNPRLFDEVPGSST